MTERDGRHIDPALGGLSGEGAQQAVEETGPAPGRVPFDVWAGVPGHPSEAGPTYYGRPAIKEPVWIWAVPAYLYAGGTAGAAAALAAVAWASDREASRGLVARSRWIAAGGFAVGTGLLIHDLGRPERFLNMLRVFRPTSPMSIGSWMLAAATPMAGASALLAGAPRRLRGVGNLAGLGAGVLGPPLASYTGVLLSNTAVPLWQAARRTLPVLFAASSVASVTSLLDLMPLGRREHRVVRRFGIVGKAAELAATVAVERDASRVERVGRPLREGLVGALWDAAKGLTAASLVVSALPGGARRRTLAGVLGTAGAIALRFAAFHAGKASSRDPRATFEQQRAGHGAHEVTGTAAVSASDGRRALSVARRGPPGARPGSTA